NEFDKVNGKTKIYELKDCENADVKIIKTKKELEYLKGEELEYLEGEEFEALEGEEFEALEGEELEALEGEDLRVFFDADKVDLSCCDLKGLKIKFKEGALVNLSYAESLPKELDVSMCSKVDLSGCNIEGLNLKFRDGAEVNLWRAEKLPKHLDVSMCSEVDLYECDLSGVEQIKFRDKAQEREFMDGAMGFNGKVEYVGDEKSIGLVNGNSGMEM
ncbi:MAG: hypothetical protein IJE43_13475, partial [Alphaproteobacteria bacterium]|nr:hypothetical protein [Alphaproteobacteria bacterium]